MEIEVGAATDIGRVREVNEDSGFLDDPVHLPRHGRHGRSPGGDVASSLAGRTSTETMFQGRRLARHGGMVAGGEANRARALLLTDWKVSGMGTTHPAVVVEDQNAWLRTSATAAGTYGRATCARSPATHPGRAHGQGGRDRPERATCILTATS